MFPNHYLHPLLRGWVDSSWAHVRTDIIINRRGREERRRIRVCRVCGGGRIKPGRGNDTVVKACCLIYNEEKIYLFQARDDVFVRMCVLTLRSLSLLL